MTGERQPRRDVIAATVRFGRIILESDRTYDDSILRSVTEKPSLLRKNIVRNLCLVTGVTGALVT